MREYFRGMALALMFTMGVWGTMQAQDPAPEKPGAPPTPPEDGSRPAPVAWTTAVEPKPITPPVKKGLDWLVEHQLGDGGWGQGDESQQMGGGAGLRDKANVADTSVAALALIRSGSTPSTGPYKEAVAKAVRFVRSSVEASDSESLAVSTIKGTRVQGKLGPNIDTFLASLLLAEVKDRMADPAENRTVEVALNKVLGKIKAHQKADGSWDNRAGWAPILAQSMAGKGINRAVQRGATVSPELLARTESYAKTQFAQAGASVAFVEGGLGGSGFAGAGAGIGGPGVGGGFAGGAAGIGGAGISGPGSVAAAPTAVGGGFAGSGGTIGGPGLAGPVAVASAPATPAGGGRGFAGSGGSIGGAGISGPGSVASAPTPTDSRRTPRVVGTSAPGIRGGLGSAGVELYDRASSLGVLQDSVNSNSIQEEKLKKLVETSKDEAVVADARKDLGRFKEARLACDNAQGQVIARLDDQGFLAGFGSNGGEEFLSYMNIGESLVLKGGPAWKKWDEAMTANLGRIQNDDGSWTGHHCITGRTFCTSTALLVLLGDRTPVPDQARGKTAVQ